MNIFGKKLEQKEIKIDDEYLIQVKLNSDAAFVGNVHKKDPENPNYWKLYVGEIFVYFDRNPSSEDAAPHWVAHFNVKAEYHNKELGHKIGTALLEHASCVEPMELVSVIMELEPAQEKIYSVYFGQPYID